MSADQDREFVMTFGLVLGLLVGISIVFGAVAMLISAISAPDEMAPEVVARISERTAPVGQVNTDPAKANQIAMAGETEAGQSGPMSGEEVVTKVCSACHAAGTLGAPKIGEKSAWQPLLNSQGLNGLVDSAIKGKGAMPPKGGNPNLSEEEIKESVVQMLEQSGINL